MSTWAVIKTEIQDLLNDKVFSASGSKEDYLLKWANRIVSDICLEIDMRYHLKTAEATITTSNFVYCLPTDYFKVSPRFTKIRVGDEYVPLVGLDTLNSYDPDHSDTDDTAVYPSCASIEGNYIWIYPAINATVVIENYYKKPTDMVATTDSPDMPYVYFLDDLIISGVSGKYGFPWLNEYEQAKEWRTTYYELTEKYRLHMGKNDSRKIWEITFY
jgi:hypothetical protein